MTIPEDSDDVKRLKHFAGGSSLLLSAAGATIKRLDTRHFDSQQFLAQLRKDLSTVGPQISGQAPLPEAEICRIAQALLSGLEKAVSDLKIDR